MGAAAEIGGVVVEACVVAAATLGEAKKMVVGGEENAASISLGFNAFSLADPHDPG